MSACPTNAITAPRVLDANLCISYLTIELREAIPVALREKIGALVYGCDICQDVCPWNVSFASAAREPAFNPRAPVHKLEPRALAREVLVMTPSTYAAAFKGSAIKRAKLWMLKRNACVVLGNVGTENDLPALTEALHDPSAIVQEHAAWALDQLGSRVATTD